MTKKRERPLTMKYRLVWGRMNGQWRRVSARTKNWLHLLEKGKRISAFGFGVVLTLCVVREGG